ncbi:hypothetical protein MUP01_04880 [Candidatus Bathyarchaeota archaeon]|nr:hypothetical protein [Candidatus Bathyarchaeota archaeon]
MNEEDTVLNTVIQYSTIRIIRSFSISVQKLNVYKKFCEVARREAGQRGFSQVLLKALEEYSHRHEEGNPQLKLTPYIDQQAQNPMRVLCIELDGALSDGRLHCRRAGMWIQGIRCYSCKYNRLRKTK